MSFINKPLKLNNESAYTGYKYESTECVVIGDVNGDGKLNTSDYFAVKKLLMLNVSIGPVYELAADINKSGKVDTTDYILIKSHFLQTYNVSRISSFVTYLFILGIFSY